MQGGTVSELIVTPGLLSEDKPKGWKWQHTKVWASPNHKMKCKLRRNTTSNGASGNEQIKMEIAMRKTIGDHMKKIIIVTPEKNDTKV